MAHRGKLSINFFPLMFVMYVVDHWRMPRCFLKYSSFFGTKSFLHRCWSEGERKSLISEMKPQMLTSQRARWGSGRQRAENTRKKKLIKIIYCLKASTYYTLHSVMMVLYMLGDIRRWHEGGRAAARMSEWWWYKGAGVGTRWWLDGGGFAGAMIKCEWNEFKTWKFCVDEHNIVLSGSCSCARDSCSLMNVCVLIFRW